MSSGIKGLLDQVTPPQEPSAFGPGFDFRKAIQGNGIPPLQLPQGPAPLSFRNPVTMDPSGGMVHRLPGQLQQIFDDPQLHGGGPQRLF